MNSKNKEVITKIIAAVETGHQVYGQADYANYGKPYQNTKNEHTITLGWGGFYGERARRLIQMIFDRDAAFFAKTDKKGAVFNVLNKNWETMRWHPTTSEKNVLIALIDSPVGHQCQDELFQKELLDAYLKQVAKDYPKADVKAQMMYCEIHHLGGRNGVNRIFKRCNGKYDLDTIMASLVADQRDKSSDNQVGDKIFWSRHLKCRQYIDEYSVSEGDDDMAVRIGSARSDERGKADGGKAGDQTGNEVSTQNWYSHSKGWVLIRAKDASAREKIARDMQYACDNPHIGYDQSQNHTLFDVVKPLGFDCSKVKTDCETDCSQLVRVCVRYAGIECGDFYTATEVDALKATGKFTIYTSDQYCKSSAYLLRGDILCTKTTGHTVVVLSNGSKATDTPTPSPTPTPSDDKKKLVKEGQKQLNNFLADFIKDGKLNPLVVDGELGKKTLFNLTWAFQYAMNRSYNVGLEVDGIFGRFSEAAARDYYTRYGQKSYVVSVLEIGMLLHALDPKGIEYPGIYGNGLKAAVMAYQGNPNFGRLSWKRLLTSTN